jgi:uncharacterized membrane protein YgcG
MRSVKLAAGVGVVGWLAAGAVGATPTEPETLMNELQSASSCVMCHAFANPQELAGEPLVTAAAWQGGMMGNSARDPVFWAGVAIAQQDVPGGTTDCVRCHAPRAFLAGRGEAVAMDELVADDLSGVDCELCHRLLDDGVTPPGNARYVIDDVPAADGDIRKRGPWDYDDGLVPMHAWAPDPYMGDSRTCGTCHDVTTPSMRVDAGGQSMGILFGEQRTYSEWNNSGFAVADDPGFRSCQDCHMPKVDDVPGCAEFLSMETYHATGGRRHDLGGANRKMVEILKGVYGDAGDGTFEDVFFDIALESIDRTLADAATLTVTAPRAVDLTEGIAAIDVRVTNDSGHKLPTGYSEGRVMWLEVVGSYEGTVVYSSGRWLDGALEGDPQQRTYEAIAVEHASDERFHLLRNNRWVVDSRIPPAGMIADVETDPVGDRYTLGGDGKWPYWDDVSYAFPPAEVVDVTPEDDAMELSVRLLYVVNTPEYIEFLADANTINAAGQTVVDLFAEAGENAPLVLEEWSAMVPLTGLMPAQGTTTSGGESSGTSSGGVATSGGEVPTSSGEVPTSGGDVPTGGGSSGAGGSSESGTTDGSSGEGGCGCRTDGVTTWWLVGVVPLLRRRRR